MTSLAASSHQRGVAELEDPIANRSLPSRRSSIRRARLPAVALIIISVAVALTLVGCAGDQAGYDAPAVNGTLGNAGDIALRDVLIPNPRTPQGSYPAGSTVPVLLAMVNQGNRPDKLIAVSSPAASQVQLSGSTDIPPGSTVISTANSAALNPPPTTPLVAGRLRITLTLSRVLPDGLNIPITFQFRRAGTVTLSVPTTGAPVEAISGS